MYLINTTMGTARLMSNDEMDIEDLDLEIYKTYRLLTNEQKDDLFMYAKTGITDQQENDIKELMGV